MRRSTVVDNAKATVELDISALYHEYWESLFKQMMRILLDEDEAADVVQQTFLDLLEMKEKIPEIKSVKSFLFIMGRNLAFKKLRRKLLNDTYRDFYASQYKEASSLIEEWIVFKELDGLIEKEIDKLPNKMKEIFILSRHFELSHAEIAKKLNISDKTVKKQISNALKLVRLKVDKDYQPLLLAILLTDLLF
ncbi:sigma-70 family RNA polymerase sigma factor [Sphingobacterium sp. UGAL515B_05]|uniref:sigma-70 family RNA polymerase sigma factor n=1 Tax=Sphingobacterium sp. UGAL515B_05 TaxID=2986767 RepID=UPI0029557123|nr:sigma-70 family RNA polymerase sigma factor [Sphingobacterium sp. UGAL515B_05]WON92702.1 sigma-70 family RNA polymerase sigma factor [Sphingobacterium sp. UGAL515B_05]